MQSFDINTLSRMQVALGALANKKNVKEGANAKNLVYRIARNLALIEPPLKAWQKAYREMLDETVASGQAEMTETDVKFKNVAAKRAFDELVEVAQKEMEKDLNLRVLPYDWLWADREALGLTAEILYVLDPIIEYPEGAEDEKPPAPAPVKEENTKPDKR